VSAAGPVSGPPQPFRPFFALAALDAIAGAAPWLAPAGPLSAGWHGEELLFGAVPAVMAGFLLTALPRWTRTSPVPATPRWALLTLWLAGRAAHWCWPEQAAPLAAAFILCLALTLAIRIVRTRRTREYKVVALLLLFAASAWPLDDTVGALPAGFASRLAFSAVLGLVALIAGRIAPALTAAYPGQDGVTADTRPPPAFEWIAALTLATALLGWCAAFAAGAVASLLASAWHVVRLLYWRPWRGTRHPGLLAIHVAYLWLPVGFALLALHQSEPGSLRESAAIHAWSVGAIGLMCLAVMASMIRRQTRRPFFSGRRATAALACGAAAVPLRLLAEAAGSAWLVMAAICWTSAFALFLAAFRTILQPWRTPAESRPKVPTVSTPPG
jgi:uncharacterized protein involved in response to NO